MNQPQINISDYSPVSVVVRTVPEDFLKNYAGLLSDPALTGKWNPNLKGPGGVGRAPGWIFPKKNEALLRQTLQQIQTGQVQPTPSERQVRYAQRTAPSTLLTSAPVSPMTPGGVSPGRPVVSPDGSRFSVQTTPYGLPSISAEPSTVLPGGAAPGYQQIMVSVISPEVGQTLNLSAEGQIVPLTVVRKVDDRQFVVQLADGTETLIELVTAWRVPGYAQAHQVTRP